MGLADRFASPGTIAPSPKSEITCKRYDPVPGTKRCKHYDKSGACSLPDEFMCIEWLKANGHNVPASLPPVEEEVGADEPAVEVRPAGDRDLFGQPVPPRAMKATTHAYRDPPASRPPGDEAPVVRNLTKIAVGGPTECWEWQGALGTGGYGHIGDDSGRAQKAHRLVMMLSGVEAGDLDVCHTCDNRRCCNPRHLFVGTHADNMRDRHRKGRTVVPPPRAGAANTQARLTEGDVAEIRWLHAANHPRRALAVAFGVSPSAITLIVNRKTWRHVP